MARTSLAERQARLERQRVRMLLEENRVPEAERKARTQRLIEAGGLVDKAGLPRLVAKAGDAAQLARWEIEGARAFYREARARDAGCAPLVIVLAGAQPATVMARLRALGFRWSKVMQHWEGLAPYEEARAAAELGATLRRVAPAGAGEPDVPAPVHRPDASAPINPGAARYAAG